MGAELLNEPLPPDYRGCYDRDFIGSWDLGGKDRTLTIEKLRVGKLRKVGDDSDTPKKEKKILVWFQGHEKGWIVNKTCAAVIAGMYGNNPAKWEGRKVTLYPTTTSAFGKTHDCIRVRPQVPLESVKSEAG